MNIAKRVETYFPPFYSKGWLSGQLSTLFSSERVAEHDFPPFFSHLLIKKLYFSAHIPLTPWKIKKGGKNNASPFSKRVEKGWQGYCELARKGWKKGGPLFFPPFLKAKQYTAIHTLKGGKYFSTKHLACVRTRKNNHRLIDLTL